MKSIVAAAALAVSLVMPAVAQNQCGKRADVLRTIMGERYNEALLFTGKFKPAASPTIELFFNPDTGTWTVITTSPDGKISCLRASGAEGVLGGELEVPPQGDPA